MYASLLRKLSIERKEAGFIFLLFFSAIVLGTYLCTFDIVAHTIFFEQWAQKDMIMAYLFSGVFGMLLFFMYSLLHKRVSFKVFNTINLSIIFLSTLVYFVLYFYSANKFTTFGGLVFMFPLNLLSLLTFWRYYRKLLRPAQTKRLFPILETGLALGMVASSVLAVLLLNYSSYRILGGITLLSIGMLFILQFLVNLFHKYSASFDHRKEHRVPVRSSLFILWSTNYTRNLLLFALISSVLGFYVHFGYMNLLKIRYHELDKLALYYSLFLAMMFFFIWIVQRFLVHKILYTHDSPYSLALLPVGLSLFFILTFIGTLVIKNGSFNDPLPLLIVLFGVNKVVYETSKNVIQQPSFSTLYRTLDIRFLQIIYPRIEGMIVMLGITIAGLLLLIGFSIVNDLLLFITIGFVITILWFYFAVKLVKGYKDALQSSYRKLRISHAGDNHLESYTEKIRKILVGDDPVKVINAMQLSAALEPLTYERSLQRMLANPQPVILEYVLRCIRNESLLEFLPELRNIKPSSEDLLALLKQVIIDLEYRESLVSKTIDLEKMVNSRNVSERVLAAEIIGARKDINYTSSLINLTREFEPDVKIAAVKAMARMSAADHSYLLIEFLNSPEYQAYAFEALVQIGDPALDYLERLFITPNTSDNILARVIRIYGKVGTAKAIELLLGKLDNQSRRITLAAIAALHEANFQANAMNVNRILNIIVRAINTMSWNFLVYTSLPSKAEYLELKNAYLKEIEENYTLLFDLLSLAYNARSIREIRGLLENGSAADISHAIEMLDHSVIEEIKPVLFPVLENITMKERVKRLQYYFPIEEMSVSEMITFTLTRDYNILSFYPRICAMQVALEMPEFEVNQELIANLFHPNRLLREVAALVIHKKDPEIFESVLSRLSDDIQFELKEAIDSFEKGEKLLLVDKFNLLRNTNKMMDLQEWILIELAHALEERKFSKGQSIDITTHAADYSIFIIATGEIQFNEIDQDVNRDEEYKLYYSALLTRAGVRKITFTEDTLMLVLQQETVQLLLNDYFEIASCVLGCVEQFKIAS
jgi:ATP:ADP antiporter, AAA family